MRNKKLYLLLGLMLTALVGVAGSFVSAVSFNINLDGELPARAEFMTKNLIPIHFKDNDNDFGGFIYFSNGITTIGEEEDPENTDPYIVKFPTGSGMECWQQVRGFYYNAERGERLRPLDGTLGSISASGGLYTRCRGEGYTAKLQACGGSGTEDKIEACEEGVRNRYADAHGYYGIVRHSYEAQEFALIAGTDYKISGGWIGAYSGAESTLIRFDNKYPVGFIYDINGGVGFVGCEIKDNYNAQIVFTGFNSNRTWNNLFFLSGDSIAATGGLNLVLDCSNEGSSKNSLISVIVDGLVGINRNASGNIGIQGNQSNEKMQYFSLVDINNMQLINYAKQKAETLCRGKWTSYIGNLTRDINCISGAGDAILAPVNKTLIVKGGRNVIVKPMGDFERSGYYDIFVDGGDILIDDSAVSSDNLSVFKKNGFISEGMTVIQFNSGVSTKRADSTQQYTGDEVAAGKFIKGNFIVNGNIKSAEEGGSGLNNVYFIYGKMTSKDTVEDLKKVFTWSCKAGSGSDGNYCPPSWKLDGKSWDNPYENAALVIIDQNYPSPLYQ